MLAEKAARAPAARGSADVLLRAGLLARKDADSFWFTIPGYGPLMAELAGGRAEMLEVVRRKKARHHSPAHPQTRSQHACRGPLAAYRRVSPAQFGEMLLREAESKCAPSPRFVRPMRCAAPAPRVQCIRLPPFATPHPPPRALPPALNTPPRARRKLRASSLGARFHLRDLIGRGALRVIETTAGAMVKLVSTRE